MKAVSDKKKGNIQSLKLQAGPTSFGNEFHPQGALRSILTPNVVNLCMMLPDWQL